MQSFDEWQSELKQWKKSSKTKFLGKRIIFFSDIGSTNTYLKENMQLQHGTIVIAQTQNQGKGQKNRTWISNPGGLYMSIKLDIKPNKYFQPFWVTGTIAIGLCHALKEFNLEPTIKWPNDVLIDGKKVAGILTESILSNEKITIIIGLGCNINNSLDVIFNLFPNLKTKISSLQIESKKEAYIPFATVLEPMLLFLESKLENKKFPDVSEIREEWLQYCQIEEKEVEIEQFDTGEIVNAIIKEVTETGSLLALVDGIEMKEFTSGDIKIKY